MTHPTLTHITQLQPSQCPPGTHPSKRVIPTGIGQYRCEPSCQPDNTSYPPPDCGPAATWSWEQCTCIPKLIGPKPSLAMMARPVTAADRRAHRRALWMGQTRSPVPTTPRGGSGACTTAQSIAGCISVPKPGTGWNCFCPDPRGAFTSSPCGANQYACGTNPDGSIMCCSR